MKLLLFLLFIIPQICLSQQIKTEIGTSTWIKNDTIIINSSKDHNYYFDKNGFEIGEWKVSRNINSFQVTDTTNLTLDSQGKTITVYSKGTMWRYFYDSLGTQIKVIGEGYKQTDTLVIIYQPHYDNSNKLAKLDQLNKGDIAYSTKYEYNGDTIITRSNHYVLKTVKLNGLITYSEYSSNDKTETSLWEYSGDGKIIYFKKWINGILNKETSHIYKQGRRVSSKETFIIDDYEVITNYEYEYW